MMSEKYWFVRNHTGDRAWLSTAGYAGRLGWMAAALSASSGRAQRHHANHPLNGFPVTMRKDDL
jgi:hypothetical protein